MPFTIRTMKKVSWRARAREAAISVFAALTLVSILYIVDFRVREGATRVASVASASNVTHLQTQLTADASKLLLNAHERGAKHVAMTAFVGTAGVLLLFMLKT